MPLSDLLRVYLSFRDSFQSGQSHLDQFDPLLDQAAKAMKEGREPPILAPMLWDALLILRHTGMRFEDVAHLKAPNAHGKKGCLDQDSESY
jgi:hypothetical protein